MNYTKRTVTSRPGLSQEAALESLQESPLYRPGTKLASFRRRGNAWVAELKIPKQAGPFPPSDDEESESESPFGGGGDSEEPKDEAPDDSDSDDSGSDGPPFGDDEGGAGGDKPKGGPEHEVLNLLHQVVQGLTDAGIIQPHPADMGGMGAGDDLGPGPEGPGGPPPAGPEGGPGPGRPPAHPPGKLAPGEMRNTPGATPVGAPAFASTRQSLATPVGPTPSVPTPGMGQQGVDANTCPPGQQMVNGICSPVQTPGAPGAMGANPVVGKVASFTATTADNISVKDAKAELEAAYGSQGYKVKQIKREAGKLHALLSVR